MAIVIAHLLYLIALILQKEVKNQIKFHTVKQEKIVMELFVPF